MTNLSDVERAILIAANEDYLSLGEADLEARGVGVHSAKTAVLRLLQQDYVHLYEIEQNDTTEELQRFTLEDASRIVDGDDAWTPPLELGARFYALFATPKGKREFNRLIGAT
jgi:hypothetical protein